MNRVLLTNYGSLYGKRMLHALLERGVELSAVVVVRQPAGYHRQLFRYVSRRVGRMQACWFAATRLAAEALESDPLKRRDYASFGPLVIETIGTSSPQTQQVLSELGPDLLLLGQTGIVRENILNIPRLATLNAHPAILPDYRGIDCCLWAILKGEFDKLGATVHLVDRGVDTGPILCRRRWAETPMPLRHLTDALYADCIRLMVEVAGSVDEEQVAAAKPQPAEVGQQYYKMGLADLRRVGRRWQRWCAEREV